jgi:predicted DNA-binding protein (MmcQ/YjbR family)
MIDAKAFQEMALSFENTEQVPHFERIGFKVIGRRMFATYLEENNTANVFLTPSEQKAFCNADKKNIYPVPNKWGEKGATTFDLRHVDKEILMEALRSAYEDIITAKKKSKPSLKK